MKIEIHSSFVKATKKLPVNIQQKVAEIIVQIQNKNYNGNKQLQKTNGL